MLEQLTFVELNPLHFLEVAATAGYDGIGLHMVGLPLPRAARYDLIEDAALRGAFAARLKASGLRLHVVEPFLIEAAFDRDGLRHNLDIAASFGAGAAGVLSFDPDAARAADSLAALNEDAMARDIALSIEPYHFSYLPTWTCALAAAQAAGGSAGVTLDVLHLVRGGEHWSSLKDMAPALVRTIQLNDGPLQPPIDRAYEAVSDRATPGEGQFGLASLIPRLPEGVPIGIEVPNAAMASAMDPLERAVLLRQRTAQLFA